MNLFKDKIKKIYSIHDLFFTIITFIISLFFIFTTKYDDWSYRYIIVLLGSLPFLCYLILIIITNKSIESKCLKKITSGFSIFLALIIIPYYFIASFVFISIEMDHPIKNIRYYHDYINSEYLLNVFPEEVPKNVKNIQLIYSPGVLQASTVLALYYVDSNLNIEDFDNKFSEKAEWVGYKNHYTEKSGLLAGISSATPIEYQDEKNFKIYLIEGSCDDSGYCNHGKFLLVAVNEKTKEVLYKSEDW